MNIKEILEDPRLNISPTAPAEQMVSQFGSYLDLLVKWNQKINLTSEKSSQDILLRHIFDSLQYAPVISPKDEIVDIGSGAGFPGIALVIARPDQHFHLIESRKRRIEWLASVKADLELENCTIHGARLEHVESFEADCITARAFAPLPRLLDLSARFSTKETRWILPKGRSAAQEVDALPKKRRALFHVEHSQTDAQAGIITGSGRIEAKP